MRSEVCSMGDLSKDQADSAGVALSRDFQNQEYSEQLKRVVSAVLKAMAHPPSAQQQGKIVKYFQAHANDIQLCDQDHCPMMGFHSP
jgi:hypothetical protein